MPGIDVVPWRATFTLLLIELALCHQPAKVDLGFILDTSPYMSNTSIEQATQIIKNFANQLSISPSTTRVAVLTVNKDLETQFLFRKHVNRECLHKELEDISHSSIRSASEGTYNESNVNFRKLLKRAIGILKESSHEVLDQRNIYIFITNSIARMKTVRPKRIGTPYEMYTIHLGTNNTKELNKDKVGSKFFVYYDVRDFKEIRKKLKLDDRSYSSCIGKGPVTDECERSCTCSDGKLTDCFRVRKEFTEMSSREQHRYLKAYKKLTSRSPYKERYEEFIFMHFRYFCYGIHSPSLFLPWHRWYVSTMENLLKEIDCGVTIPYWDWSFVNHNAWNITNLWSSDGLGGNGETLKGYCVQNGMFKESVWQTPYWENPLQIIAATVEQLDANIDDQRAHLAYCLRRAMHGRPPGVKSIKNILKIPPRRFRDFNLHIIQNYHNKIHNLIGGTMSTDFAGNAPEFFLHHSFLDKIWYMWQSKSYEHKYVHFLQRNVTKMMGCNYTRRDYIDSHDLPKCIKVRYTTFPPLNHVVTSQSRQKRFTDGIDDMPRSPDKFWDPILRKQLDGDFPSCKSKWKDKKRAHELHLEIDL